MSNDTTEDHWRRRCEKLEEEVAKKDKKIDELEERVNRLEGLLANTINQIKTITLELNSAKETAAAVFFTLFLLSVSEFIGLTALTSSFSNLIIVSSNSAIFSSFLANISYI